MNWGLGPKNHDALDLSCLPCGPDEHYLVKHKTDWYECLKCHRTGQHVRDEPCTPKQHVAATGIDSRKSNHPKLAIEDCKSEETLLEALLEEELALSQMLEEAIAMDVATHDKNGKDDSDDESLQTAIALSMEKPPAKRKLEEVQSKQEESGNELQKTVEETDGSKEETKETEPQENDDDDADGLEKALAMSMETLPPHKDIVETVAASTEVLSSEKNRYNMQCLVNMGFSKQQAIYGVKRALEGSGSLDVAQQHASWRCDAELLMEKRRRLDHLKHSSMLAPQPVGTILSFILFSLRCTANRTVHRSSLHHPKLISF